MKKISAIIFALIAVFFLVAGYKYYCYRNDYSQAEKYAIALARELNEKCNESGQCPEGIQGWESVTGDYSYIHEIGRSHIPLYFYCDHDHREFSFYVKHRFLKGEKITGGVDKQIQVALSNS